MVKKIFCYYHLFAKGDYKKAYGCDPEDPKAKLFCGAHLAEGRAFQCPYKSEEIFIEEGQSRIAHTIDGKRRGYCGDFELPKEESSELVSKIQDLKSEKNFTPLGGGDDDISIKSIDNYDDL